jgi:hypothetical protein
MTIKRTALSIGDAGTYFTGHNFHSFCHTNNVKIHNVAPENQRANGRVERAIRTIKSLISKATFAINNSFNRNILCSPHEKLYGQSLISEKQRKINKLYKNSNSTDTEKEIRTTEKRNNDAKASNRTYKVGDLVKLRNFNRTNWRKIKWNGPYKVLEMGKYDKYWFDINGKKTCRNQNT